MFQEDKAKDVVFNVIFIERNNLNVFWPNV